jgi:DNA polymerase alpha subunit A
LIGFVFKDGTTNSATQRAYLKSEIDNLKLCLKVDHKYYLSQQIHPIISRLCEPIEGIDAVHIATCLGIDPSHFKSKSTATGSLQINPALTKQQQKLQSYINEAEKYKNCTPFKFVCPTCKTENVWKEPFVKNEVFIFLVEIKLNLNVFF